MKQLIIIEDNDEDFEVIEYALQKNAFSGKIRRFRTGDEALQALDNNELSTDTWLILLDLNLPGLHGVDVLKALKQHDNMKQVPVIIVTTSKDHRDIKQCYLNHANSYIQKPVDFNGFIELVGKILFYWEYISISPKNL